VLVRYCCRCQVDEAARFESERAEELRKLHRDRRVLEKQRRALLKMPTKQSKEEVAAVEVRQLPGLMPAGTHAASG
jgi:hypothetical protein